MAIPRGKISVFKIFSRREDLPAFSVPKIWNNSKARRCMKQALGPTPTTNILTTTCGRLKMVGGRMSSTGFTACECYPMYSAPIVDGDNGGVTFSLTRKNVLKKEKLKIELDILNV